MNPEDLDRYRARAKEVLEHQGDSLRDVGVRNGYALDLAHLVLLMADEIERQTAAARALELSLLDFKTL